MDKAVSEFLQCPRLTATGNTTGGLRWLLFIYLGALILAAVVAPLVYLPLRSAWLADPGVFPDWRLLEALTSRLEPHDFPRWFDRLRWLPVVLALPFLLRFTGLNTAGRLGFRGDPNRALIAFGLGIAMFFPVLLAQEASYGLEARGTGLVHVSLEVVGGALLSGVLIAFLEETVFRGLILRVFAQAMKPWLAVIASALFFALVHFKHVAWPEGAEPNWLSGFWVAEEVLLAPLNTMEPIKFFTLFAAGILLNLVAVRWRSLWPCIGLHAGWVFYLRIHRAIFPEPEKVSVLWGGPAVFDGLLPLAVMLGAICWLVPRSGLPARPQRPRPPLRPELRMIGKDAARLFENTITILRNTAGIAAKAALLVLALVALLIFFEDAWLETLRQPPGSLPRDIAGWVSKWGDFYRLNLILLVGGLLMAWLKRLPHLRRAMLAVFLAALMAGVAVNLARPLIGRPRPSAQAEFQLDDRPYGPNLDHAYHGFPSGHAATAFATGTALTVVAPPLAIPALGGAVAITWSRLALNRHQPTDSLAGAALGIWLGLAAGYAARRRDYVRLEPLRW
ncbi:MAG: phosphatase PAP2 family protein [Opitutales bacterium]